MYTLCSQVYTFVLFFCGGVAARRVAEYCSATPDTTQRDAQGGGRGGWWLKKNACATRIGAHVEHSARFTVLCVRCSTVRAPVGVVAVVQVFFTCTRCAPRCTRLSFFFFAEGSLHVVSPSTARPPLSLRARRADAPTPGPTPLCVAHAGSRAACSLPGALGTPRSHSGRGVRCPRASRPEVL